MRMRASLRERRRQVIYDVPNLLTTGNLFCGLYAIMAVFGANYVKGAIAILVALIFDILDGQSARGTKTTSQFGIEYDSLADLVAFGVAPGGEISGVGGSFKKKKGVPGGCALV